MSDHEQFVRRMQSGGDVTAEISAKVQDTMQRHGCATLTGLCDHADQLERLNAQLRAELEQERAAHAIEVEAGKQLATSLKYALADADGFGELLDWWEKEFPAAEGERAQAETHAEVRARVERSRDPLKAKIRRLENGAQVMHSLYASAKAEIEALTSRLAHADEMIRRLTGVDAPPVPSSDELRAHVERLMGELDELRARVEVKP